MKFLTKMHSFFDVFLGVGTFWVGFFFCGDIPSQLHRCGGNDGFGRYAQVRGVFFCFEHKASEDSRWWAMYKRFQIAGLENC